MYAYPYPGILQALEAARNLRGALSGGIPRQNVANDAWVLQGYAQYYLIGNPVREMYGSRDVTDGQMCDILDQIIGNAETLARENEPPLLGATSNSIDWHAVLLWCTRAIVILLLSS
jgi:hypothetical protein